MSLPAAKYVALAAETKACRQLLSAFARGRGSHAYLLESPDTLLSVCCAAAVACADGAPSADLSSARSRRILGGLCADVLFFGDGGLKAEDADAIVNGCLVTPSELKSRYYILNMTDANEAAQNKLLKTLEESPECAVFFLAAPSRSSLLPTVASRCETVTPVLGDDVAELPGGTGAYLAHARYGGRGSLTAYEGLLSGESAGSLSAAIEFVTRLAAGERLRAASALPGKRDELAAVLGFTEKIYGDIMKYECGMPVDTYGLYDIGATAAAYPLRALPSVLAEVRRAVRRSGTGNLTSVADALVIRITEVVSQCRE